MTLLIVAHTTHDGRVALGRYETSADQRRAYTAARKRLTEGGYSPDVRDIALGEDPAYRQRAVMDAMHPLIQEVMQL